MSERAIYLIPGGHPPDMSKMIEDVSKFFATFGNPSPKIAYVGTANNDNKLFFRFMKRPLLKAGAREVTMAPIAGKHLNVEKAQSVLAAADCVFLSGGEVEDGIVWLQKAGLDGYLTELYNGGMPFFGVSAGCIMMGQNWVHWEVEDDDNTARLFDCLGFVPFTFDTHCENEDWKELKCALRLIGSGALGHGLSTGGFYSADSAGGFQSYRNPPALYTNRDGTIEAVEWDG